MIDLCFIAESWVNSEDNVTELSVLNDFEYKFNVVDRKNRTGAGVIFNLQEQYKSHL